MRKITQRDIFIYLTLKPKDGGHTEVYHTQEKIAESVSKVFHISSDRSSINHIIKGDEKRKGYANLDLTNTDTIDTFYQDLFGKELSGDVMKAMLSHAVNFVAKNKLVFDGCQGLADDTFETYLKRMFAHGLTNLDDGICVSDPQEQVQEADPACSLRSDNLAFYRIDFFTGRDSLLEGIRKHLDRDRFVVLNGMGGIGKSTLAKRFADCNSARYSSIQIVSGESQDNFESVVLTLRFDGLKDEKEPPEERYQRRLELLRQLDERSLIIIDNVDVPWTDIQKFYADQREMRFHLIITSRLAKVFWEQFYLPVASLPDGEQRKLFLHHYGMNLKEQTDSPILDEILRHIEGHTLLIELIAKTMYNESESFDEILEWLRGQKTDHGFMEDGERKEPKEVIRKMLFRDKLDDEQRDLLHRLAFLPAEGISRRLFLHGLCRSTKSPLSLLEYRSWVIREGDRIRVHPVIRDAVRDDMPHEWAAYGEFLRLIQQAMEQSSGGLGEEDQTSLCLLARGMWEVLRNSKVPLELWDCLSAIAGYCKTACQYEAALLLCEPLSCIEDDMADVDKRIELHLEIGGLHQRSANYDKAIEHYRKALGMTRQDDDQRGSCYNSLGVIYRKNAEYKEAMEYLENALNCYTREDLIATVQNDLGVVYINLGSNEPDPEKSREFYQKAKAHYEGSLRLREKLGADVRDLAFSHHNLGSVFYRLGEYDKALEEHQEALRLRKDNHLQKPDIAASLNWIGNDLIQLGRLPEAKEQLEESLDIRKKVLGKRHPDLAWALISLSEYYEEMNEFPRAIQLMQEACDIRKEQLRPGHPYTSKAEQRLDELKKRTDELASPHR